MLLRQLDTLGHSLTTVRVHIPAGASEKVISDVRGCFSPGAPFFSAIYYWLASDDLAQIGQKKGLFSLILTHTHSSARQERVSARPRPPKIPETPCRTTRLVIQVIRQGDNESAGL